MTLNMSHPVRTILEIKWEVEVAEKSAKRMLKKTRESGADQYLALSDTRNTPTNYLAQPNV